MCLFLMQKPTAGPCNLIPVYFSSHMTLGQALGISRPPFIHPKSASFFLYCFLLLGSDVVRFSLLVFLNIHEDI